MARCRWGVFALGVFALGVAALVVAAACSSLTQAQDAVDFNRDIRPILSDTCFQCHGPDENAREAELRLDLKDGLFADLDGNRVVAPGKTGDSELFRRITSSNPDTKMPPADSGKELSPQQVALIKKWIEQGAKWQQHWSFVTPNRSELPATKNTDWCRNAIDHFVLARLEKEGLAPSPAADRATLIRRVTLDLTGLPPTIEEVDAFLTDDSPDAYEKVVDRLLKSPRYGERMAIRWLDAARYADTSGYQNDGPRDMWRWRDWVIDAYNQNMPFDQFTIEQLAGDLLEPDVKLGPRGEGKIPEPEKLNRLIATAFNRNHRGNAEGGIIAEEYQVEYVVDRVDTTATVWLGLTMGCARCHDHKYDPISQTEFYQVFAYFNNIPEDGRAIKEGNSPPYIKAPTLKQRQELERLKEELSREAEKSGDLVDEWRKSKRDWEKTLDPKRPIDWVYPRELLAQFGFDDSLDSNHGTPVKSKITGGDAAFVEGKIGRALELKGGRFVNAGDVAKFGYFDAFSATAWIRPDAARTGTVISRMTKTPRGDGYYIHLEDGKVQVNLVKRWLDDSIRVETKKRLRADEWQHIAVTYDGSRRASGITVYFNGQEQDLLVHHDFLNQTFASDEPLRIGAGHSNFSGKIDDLRIYRRAIRWSEVHLIRAVDSITAIAARPNDERTFGQGLKIQVYYFEHVAPMHIRESARRARDLQEKRFAFEANLPTVMVMQEMDRPRETFVLERGQYNKPTKKVATGVPSIFAPLPADAPKNRLGLARWLVDPANPLTARVAINRYWLMYFGSGIVGTVEDFGSQGARPTHPLLLDWLATEFVRSGWDVKAMQKLIVMSATYRQTSRMTKELLERDPDNRLLARAPRLRLPAEMVRDQALAAAGLLHERLGGPSVKPYQPDGLWKEIATDTKYDQSSAPDLYRRSLYTYWKRTVTPPTMSTFDASAREMCTVRQVRTNTPLQALALMNDVTYVEAARTIAERSLKATGGNPNEALWHAFRLVLARRPTLKERVYLSSARERYVKAFEADKESAQELLSVGDSEPNKELDATELAALTMVASLILNLDETVTKE